MKKLIMSNVEAPNPVTVNGVSYAAKADALRALGVSYGGVSKRRKTHNETFEQAVLAILANKKPPTEFRGKVYRSLKGLAADYGVNYDTFLKRRESGWSLESAVDTPVADFATRKLIERGQTIEFNGKRYTALKHIADEYGVEYDLFHKRLTMGWPIERAVTEQSNRPKHDTSIVVDGKKFDNYTAAAKHLGVDPSVFSKRVRAGAPLVYERKVIYERDGVKFHTLREIGEYFDCDVYALSAFITKRGYTIGEAVEKASELGRGNRVVTGVDGNDVYMGVTYAAILARFGLTLRDVRYHFGSLDDYISDFLLASVSTFVALTDDGFVIRKGSTGLLDKITLSEFLDEVGGVYVDDKM